MIHGLAWIWAPMLSKNPTRCLFNVPGYPREYGLYLVGASVSPPVKWTRISDAHVRDWGTVAL